ncbi:MAG: pyridoxine 5'-phosphate synthase [Flavobacteriia bacterium]|nr:MAG: pyridoxine 5'-phosphate synthase [Flavobacteriia bacterium]
MTKLSVNINKIATLRNARGGDYPNVVNYAIDIQKFGAQGITIHPRPDERHIRYQDARDLKSIITTEFNIEGNPIPKFIDLVLEVKPDQVTLVPDAPDAITSDAGWDTIKHQSFLKEVIAEFKRHGIRTSIFIDTNARLIEAAATTGTDRVELYTERFASSFAQNNTDVVHDYAKSAVLAHDLGMGVNAGHDLNLENIAFFKKYVPNLDEVSIGHALIAESLYLGLENVINMYKQKLQ